MHFIAVYACLCLTAAATALQMQRSSIPRVMLKMQNNRRSIMLSSKQRTADAFIQVYSRYRQAVGNEADDEVGLTDYMQLPVDQVTVILILL